MSCNAGSLFNLTKVELSFKNKSKMLSFLVGWVTTCVRLNSLSRSEIIFILAGVFTIR